MLVEERIALLAKTGDYRLNEWTEDVWLDEGGFRRCPHRVISVEFWSARRLYLGVRLKCPIDDPEWLIEELREAALKELLLRQEPYKE